MMMSGGIGRVLQVKQYLREYRYIKPNLKYIERRLRENENKIPATTAQYSERVSGGLPGSAVEQFVINRAEEDSRLLEEQLQWLRKKQEIEEVVSHPILTPIESLILKNRYIDLYGWEKVAMEQHYSRRGAIKIHNAACEKLYEVIKKEEI